MNFFINDDISINLNIESTVFEKHELAEENVKNMFANTCRFFFNDLIDSTKHCAIVVVDKEGTVKQWFFNHEGKIDEG